MYSQSLFAMLVMVFIVAASETNVRVRSQNSNTSVELQGVDSWGYATVGKGPKAQVFRFVFDTGK